MAIQEQFSAKWSNYMSLVETVKAITREQMLQLAQTIEGELKAEASNHKSTNRHPTGMAAASIHIEEEDEAHIFVGAHASFPKDGNDGGTHLYYMDQGNGGGTIRSSRKYDRRGREPGKLQLWDGSYRTSVSGYSGKGFIKKVADRHR